MKKGMMLFTILLFTIIVNAQNDSTNSKKQDTIKVGNIIIVGGSELDKSDRRSNVNILIDSKNRHKERKDVTILGTSDTLVSISDDTVKVGRIKIINKSEDGYHKDWQSLMEGDFKKTKISIEKTHDNKELSRTNWWIFDLGFANYFDATSYSDPSFTHPLKGAPLNAKSFSLNNTKSSNVNIWIVQKKTPIAKENWYFKYGIGWQMYNFRFDQPISFRNEGPSYVYLDSKTFSKDKLYVNYLSVPLMINYTAKERKGLNISAGLNVGYLVGSRNKQIAENKMKYAGKFNLNDFQVAGTGEIGIGNVKLYASASLTNLYNRDLTKQFNYPFAIGVRFSRF